MATIEKRSETIVEESFVLTVKRDELKELLSNPRPWLRQLRAALKSEDGTQVKARRGTPRRNGHHRGKPKRAAKSASGGFECQHCHRVFRKAGNRDNHEAKCEVEIGAYQPAGA